MLFRLILPVLFSVTALVGIGLLANAVFGLLKQRAYGPVFTDGKQPIFAIQNGADAKRWATFSLLVAVPMLVVASIGFFQLFGYMQSPGFLRHRLEPPEPYTILYAVENNGEQEIGYGFAQPLGKLVEHFRRQLEDDGWETTSPSGILLVGKKSGTKVTVSFIGSQPGDQRNYSSKVIVTFIH